MDVGRPGRMAVEDIIFLICKDAKMYSWVKKLLTKNEELLVKSDMSASDS